MTIKKHQRKGTQHETISSFDRRRIGACADARHAAASAEDALDPNAKQGGAIIVTYKDDVATLDPAIGYDWQNWSMIKSLFDGLMDYEPGTTKLRPDLAESYEISPDGKTFTFKLRHGVKFHNGREMTADDVKYSLDRVTNPKTQSPGAGFFGSIKGYRRCRRRHGEEPRGRHRRRSLHGQVRADAARRHLPACHGDQLRHVVPKEEVEKYGADFGKHPVGTGAYKLAEWTLGQRLVFERNPDYWQQGPAASRQDHLRDRPGADRGAAAPAEGRGRHARRRHSAGEIPGGDGRSRAEGARRRGRPAAHRLRHHEHATWRRSTTSKVRQAVNMAINKDRIVQLINNRAVPANQPLPPSMPGYDKDFKGYAYDVDKAKALLAEAGHPDGFETELFAMNTDPNPRIAQAIQQDLAAIGIKANIQSLAQANVIAAGGDKAGAPMIWSGGMAWIADFPDPSNFYGPILGCGGAVHGRLELVVVLQQGSRRQGGRGRLHHRPGQGRGARQDVERDLRQDHGGRALGAGLQRAALHHAVAAHGRRRQALSSIRSISRSTTTTCT